MDKSEIDGLPVQLAAKLKAESNPSAHFDLKQRYANLHYTNLHYATQISLQYLIISSLWLLLAALLSAVFQNFPLFSLVSGYAAVPIIAISTLLIYLLLRRQSATPSPTSTNIPEPQHRLDERTDELSRMLNVSQGVNAKLEVLLADQAANAAANAVKNARLHEEAGQIAIQEERQRLGRDLHDSVTQALYSMVLFADATSLALAANKLPEATENLYQVRKMARQAMADMRLLIYQLHPPLLKKEGLAAALQTRLEAVESRAGLQTSFHTQGENLLTPLVEGEFYRIAQEALNNVIKHAKAEHVSIELNCTGATCAMTIADDGIGFDIASAQTNGGVGLRSIAERAKHIHARLTLESTPNHGSKLRVEV